MFPLYSPEVGHDARGTVDLLIALLEHLTAFRVYQSFSNSVVIPALATLILEHICLQLLVPDYKSRDNQLVCILGHHVSWSIIPITSRDILKAVVLKILSPVSSV